MLEMGFGKDYSFEPVVVTVADGGGMPCNPITAYNEYYYLVNKVLPALGYIEGDNTVMTPDDIANYSNYSVAGIQEFTGNIVADNQTGADVQLEFIRVVPRVNRADSELKYVEELFSKH